MKTLFLLYLALNFNLYATINHDLKVEVIPDQNYLKVFDHILFQNIKCPNNIRFTLHEGLNPKIVTPLNAKLVLIEKIKDEVNGVGFEHFMLELPCGTNQFQVSYEGVIFHPVKDPEDPYSRGTSDSPGLISKEGVVLSSATNWYPILENNEMLNFRLEVKDQNNFTYMSQGQN